MYHTHKLVTGMAVCLAVAFACAKGDSPIFADAKKGTVSAPPAKKPAPYAAKMNKKFSDPNANIDEFVKRFENEARNVFVKRHAIVRAVGLKPGDRVADIGPAPACSPSSSPTRSARKALSTPSTLDRRSSSTSPSKRSGVARNGL